MLMLFGLTISAPFPQGVTTRVRLRGTSLIWPLAAGWVVAVGAGAAAAGALVGLAAVVGAAAAGAVVGLAAAVAGGAVAAGAVAWGALVHAVASRTRPSPSRANGCLRGVTTILPSLVSCPRGPPVRVSEPKFRHGRWRSSDCQSRLGSPRPAAVEPRVWRPPRRPEMSAAAACSNCRARSNLAASARAVGIEQLSAARVSPSRPRTGTATQRKPRVYSSLSVAYPRWRTSASTALSVSISGIVDGVNRGRLGSG